MIKISNYLKQKGQGIVEYAILLAFILGVAVLLQSGGLKDSVVGIFDDATKLFANLDKEDLYKTAMDSGWAKKKLEDLKTEATSEQRLAADMAGLQNLADWFIDKDAATVMETFGNQLTDKNGVTVLDIDDRSRFNRADELSRYTYQNKERNENTIAIMGASTDIWKSDVYNGNGWVYSKQRYFFSDTMTDQNMHNVKVSLTYGDDGKVTSSKVFVDSSTSELSVSATKK